LRFAESTGKHRAAVVVSVLFSVLMVFLLGQDGTIASAAPIILVAAISGPRWGLIAGLISYPANALAVWLTLGSPFPFLSSAGGVLGTVAAVCIGWVIGRAVKLRKHAESLMADAFEFAPNGMAIISLSGNFERVNPACAELLKRPASELVGRNWRDITPQDQHEENTDAVGPLFTGMTNSVRIYRKLVSDGKERLVAVHLSVVRRPDGQPTHLLAQMEDETDLAQANVSLRALLDSKDRFLAAISHELRTPLSAVNGLAYELRDRLGNFSMSEISELAGLIAQQGTELAGLVEDFLVHARADTGQIRVRREQVDLVAEVRHVLRAMQASTGMRLVAGDEAVVTTGDSLRVRQIIRNLLQNAHRYGGPAISIEARHLNGRSTLTVTDNGDGIEEHVIDSIFEPYERSHENPGLTESLGIGLHISRTLARLMGGDITYHREAANTCFVLTLPTAEQTNPAVPASRPLAEAPLLSDSSAHRSRRSENGVRVLPR